MRKSTKNASLHEALRNLWKIRIMLEKNYTETCATWMTRRIESLIDHMQYGHALIAYHKQDGTFRLAKATLLPYKADFRRDYDITRVTSTISLNYEWNFGASFGWKPYDEYDNPENQIIGSKVNAYLNVNLYLKWSLSSCSGL